MDVDTDFMSRIHKEQKKQRKHKRSYSDWSASPTDQLSYDPSQMGDADLLIIPDTPSPVFNGRKTKVKLSGKIPLSVNASDMHNHLFYDVKKQHKPMNENSPNHDVSPNGIANGASPEVNYHNGSVQLKDASPKKVKLTLRIKKQRSLENDIADMDKVASGSKPEGKYHHGNIRLKDASPKKVESTSRLNKQRLHENEMADMDDVASDASPEVHYHHGSIQLKDASPKKVESTFRLKKQRSPEKCVTSKTIDITNSNEPVDSDSTDVYYVEESNDVLFLSSEAASSSESAVCTSGCPRTDSGSSHIVAYRHSPKKRLFQNGIRKRELTETDTLCSATVSQSVGSRNGHQLHQKLGLVGESSQLKRRLNGDRHSQSSRHREDAPSFCRVTGRTEIIPSSTQSWITSPSSRLSEKSFHHGKHVKSHHRKHSSGIGTPSVSANWNSLPTANVPCKGNRHTSRDADEVTCFPSFKPASSLIDLTKTPVHVPNHEVKSWRSPAFHLSTELASPTRRHKHSHRKNHRREKRKSDGSDGKMANVLSQLEQDEAMARRLQEEMDRDFALSLAESENRTTADSSTSPELPRDLADNLHQVIGDLEMATSNIIDYGPIHVRSRGANTCVHVTDAGEVVSVGFTANSFQRPPRGGRRRGGRHRHRFVEYYQQEQNDGNDYEFLLGLAEQIGDATANVGLCRQHIDLLPQRLYSGPQTGRDVSCNICMCDYETGDNLRMLPCFHEFHQSCIDTWIQKNATCPICRVDIEVGQS